jgi:hypothetical protein
MNDLTDYFPTFQLETAEEFGKHLAADLDTNRDPPIRYEATGPRGYEILDDKRLSVEDRCVIAMQMISLRRFMHSGPIIIRPAPELCELMAVTEVRINAADYRQPYEVIGVELPRSLVGDDHPCLVMVWNPQPGIIMCWCSVRRTGMTYHNRISIDLPTIEDRLIQGEAYCDDEREHAIMVRGQRLAINLCLLMAHRSTDLTPLPPKVARNRRAGDPRLRALARRQFQRVIFRDLVVKPSPRSIGGGGGIEQNAQLRKGHWKMVPHGIKMSLRKLAWIEPYWTKGGEDEGERPITIYE